MFSAYYPSCSSVFGFYDDLEGVPSDAVLTYFVLGYYSNSANDILNGVKTIDDMKIVLEKYHLSVSDEKMTACNTSVLFDLADTIFQTESDYSFNKMATTQGHFVQPSTLATGGKPRVGYPHREASHILWADGHVGRQPMKFADRQANRIAFIQDHLWFEGTLRARP